MSTSQPSTQSATARRSAEADLRGLVANFAPAHEGLVGTMRRSLRKRLPTAYEVVYEYYDCFVISYSPNERGYEGVLAVRASATGAHVNAEYISLTASSPTDSALTRRSGGRGLEKNGLPAPKMKGRK
jgi:hypothetical protein